MGSLVFRDRREAGRVLASRLEHYRDNDAVMVLALPRGGVPVAYEVARELRAPLDVFVVRKLGAPGFPEVAVGAIASGDVVVTTDDAISGFGVSPDTLEEITEAERRELRRREKAYRDDRPPADIEGKTVIVVDDGLATGATMRAALKGIRARSPGRIVVAVPVAPEDTCEELSAVADEVVCVTTPELFTAVGASYQDFDQTSDDDVRRLLTAGAFASARP